MTTAAERAADSKAQREASRGEPDRLPGHWSHSQLETLNKCGVQYAFAYVEKIRRPPGIAMIRGTGAHEAREKALIHRIDAPDEDPLTHDEIEAIARDRTAMEFEGEVAFTDEERARGVDRVKGETIDIAVSLARLDRSVFIPKIDPVSVEEWIEWKPDNFPRSIVAVVDCIDRETLRDLKTGKRITAGTEDVSQQLTIGAMVWNATRQKKVARVGFDNLITNKKPDAARLESARGREDYDRVLTRIARAEETVQLAMKHGGWSPAPESAWWCDRRYCGYFDICPYARRRTSYGVGGKGGGRPMK